MENYIIDNNSQFNDSEPEQIDLKEYTLYQVKGDLEELMQKYCTPDNKDIFLSLFEQLSKLEQKLI